MEMMKIAFAFCVANAPKNADKFLSGFSQITDIHSVNGTLCYWLTAEWQKKCQSDVIYVSRTHKET